MRFNAYKFIHHLSNLIFRNIGKTGMLVPIIGISRHRINTDGEGIRTLMGFHGCPLRCKYCLNPQALSDQGVWKWISKRGIINEISKDDLYYRTSDGGITFGGGEPCLFYKHILSIIKDKRFVQCNVSIETSLNVPTENIQSLIDFIDEWIIDIKDMNPSIYKAYTGQNNELVITNLKYLALNGCLDKVIIRIPLIPNFNTNEDIEYSISVLNKMGYVRFDRLEYVVHKKESSDDNKGVYGKAVCNLLKSIRKDIIISNKINFEQKECPHKTCLSGNCPACEYELKTITKQIHKIEKSGNDISFELK